MNVYLASGFHQRQELRKLAAQLKERDYNVCSTWIWVDTRPERGDEVWDLFAKQIATSNILDLSMADILIVDGNGISETNHGGVAFETGFCFSRGKPVFLIGPKGNTFHWLDAVIEVKDYE